MKRLLNRIIFWLTCRSRYIVLTCNMERWPSRVIDSSMPMTKKKATLESRRLNEYELNDHIVYYIIRADYNMYHEFSRNHR